MNDTQRKQIDRLRSTGISYGGIAKQMGLSVNTVKSYCRRSSSVENEIADSKSPAEMPEETVVCEFCGRVMVQLPHRKKKRFCSDTCRSRWWSAHPEKVNRKANYECTCGRCGKRFISYGNQDRKYCSRACYIEDRFGGEK